MARYIDADALIEMLNNKAKTDLEMGLYNHHALTESFIRFVERQPNADVVQKSEYDAVVEENESLGIELENMRRNLGDAREGWNDAECEVEKLREINSLLTEAGQEWQRRYNNAKADVAREIFDLVELKMFCNRYEHIPFGSSERVKYYDIELEDAIAELRKKYTEGEG